MQREVSTQLTEGLLYLSLRRITRQVVCHCEVLLAILWQSQPLKKPSLCKGRGILVAVEGVSYLVIAVDILK